MEGHLSSQELADLAAGELSSPARNRAIVRHLISGCPTCRERLRSFESRDELPGFLRRFSAGAAAPPSYDYERAFASADRTLTFFLSEGRPVAEPPGSLLAELGRGPGEIGLTPESSALPFLVRWFIEKSHACRHADPEAMMQWALMARIGADTCSPAIAGSARKLADLRARAEAQLANTLRMIGRSEEAEATLRAAWDQLAKGTGDAELRASMLLKETSLLNLQRSFPAAIDRVEEAKAIRRRFAVRHELAAGDVLQALVFNDAGEPEQSARLLESATPWLDPEEDESLPIAALINLAHTYRLLEQPRRALALIRENRPSRREKTPKALRLKLEWQEGMLLADLGFPLEAERILAGMRAGFIEQRRDHGIVLATADLVRVQLELGKRQAAERETAAMSARFETWTGGPEVLQALHELQALTA